MGKYTSLGKTYDEVMKDAQQFLELPPLIALPGGTWCPFCKKELCRNMQHHNAQLLQLLVSKMAKQIEDLNKGSG